jgi:hypothetical protein
MNAFRAQQRRSFGALVIAALLTACGGGGGDNDDSGNGTPSVPVQGFAAQGAWSGTDAPDGDAVYVLVLEDGTVWGYSGVADSGGFSIDTLYQGALSANGNELSGSDLRAFDLETGDAAVVGLRASLASTTLTLTASVAGEVTSTTAAMSLPSTLYNYNQPARLSDLAGTWSGTFTTGDSGSLVVDANGGISGTTEGGCSVTGTATTRASGKNVFNVDLRFGAAPCARPNGTASGVAVIEQVDATQRQLSVTVISPNRDAMDAFFGVR